jgi:hypothetical protein
MLSFRKFNLVILAAILSVAGPMASAQRARLSGDEANPRVRLDQADRQKLERFRRGIAGAPGFDKFRDGDRIDESYNPSVDRTRVIVLLRLDGSLPQRERFRSERNRSTWRGEVSGRQTEVINGLAGRGITVLTRYQNFPALVCEVTAEGLRALMAHPNVEAIQPDALVEKHTAQGIPLMHADTLRTLHNGSGVTIAVIDDGVDYTHPDLGNGGFPNSKVISGYDIADKDTDPFSGTASHGTNVSGIVAGNIPSPITSDYIGGVAPGAKIAAVKVFKNGSSTALTSDIVLGIDWCVTNQNLDPNNPIMVINMSLGGGNYASSADAAYAEAIEFASINAAVAAGITVVASSGNSGYCHSMAAPAALEQVISVGAAYDDSLGTLGMYIDDSSCYPHNPIGGGQVYVIQESGPGVVTAYSNTADFLSVLAPSHNAYTTATGGGYNSGFGGTSAASPYVAGVVALLQSAARTETGAFLTPDTVRSLLTTTGTPVEDNKGGGISPGIEKPLVNAQAAYLAITSGRLPEISVSDSSLSFIMPAAASSTKPLVISNNATAGGLDVRYSVKASVSGSFEDTIGSAKLQNSGVIRYIGNIFQATSNSKLTLIEPYLNFKGTALFDFVVYETDSPAYGSASNKIYGATVNLTSTGPGFYNSGPIEVPLQAGKYYIIATGWGATTVRTYFDSNPSPLVSFGQKAYSVILVGTFPLPDTFSNDLLLSNQNFYQRITAGKPSWLSVNSLSGIVASGMNENVNVTANATGLTSGTYQGKITITSNDSDERQFDIPVGLRIGLLGDVYVRLGYVGAEFGTMAAPYNSLGEAQEAVDPGPSSKITIVGGGTSPEILTFTKQVTIQATDGDATIGKVK